MNKVIIIGIIVLLSCSVYSQDTTNHVKTENLAFIGLRAIIYPVSDLNIAMEWYSKAFEAKPNIEESDYIGFNINGYHLGLQSKEMKGCDEIKNIVNYWGVTNIQLTYERLIELGATINERPYSVGGEMMLATLIDPFGNIIGLEYNPYSQLKK